jgi:hypothetical protein
MIILARGSRRADLCRLDGADPSLDVADALMRNCGAFFNARTKMENITISKAVNARDWCVAMSARLFANLRALRARPANVSVATVCAGSAHLGPIAGTLSALLVPIDLPRQNFPPATPYMWTFRDGSARLGGG